MKEVSVWELRSGDILARPILSPSGIILLREGKQLTDGLIQRLKKMNVRTVHIREKTPELDVEPAGRGQHKQVLDKKPAATHQKSEWNIVQTLTHYLDYTHLYDMLMNTPRREAFRVNIRSIIHSLVTTSPFLRDQLAALHRTDLFLFHHTLKVAISAAIVGMARDFSHEQLRELTVCALCFDIGMIRLPEQLVKKTKPLTKEEREELEKHTIYGFQILHGHKDLPKSAALCALQHHERYDGTGYPYRAKQTDIHPYAQIIALCDVFNALISPRHHRNAYSISEAVEFLYAAGNKYFDVSLIQLFLKHICVYPVKTRVLLSNGKIGVVTSPDNQTVCRPVVKIIQEPDGSEAHTPYEIDLKQNVDVVIVSKLG